MKKGKSKLSLKLLGRILTVVVIILIAVISFVGIFVQDKNSMKNIIPEYKLGMDLYGARNIIIKVDESNESNTEEVLTLDNYQKSKEIAEQRLAYMKVENYLIRENEANGDISLEVTENNDTDYIAQYVATKGEFKVVDNDTSEVLLSNKDVEKASATRVQASTSSYTAYLTIQFNKEGTEKLKEISQQYISSKDSEGNDTTKKIKMMLDDETIITTYFDEEISDGIIELSLGTTSSTSELESYYKQAQNIAVFLNTDQMPITYKIDVNRFVYSDITVYEIKIMTITFTVIAVLAGVAMIVRFKKNGVMGAFTSLGFIALLLLAVRFGNVELTLAGIFAIAVSYIIEYFILWSVLKEYSKGQDLEHTKKNVNKAILKIVIALVPVTILAVTFALISWQEISSVGMILFWAELTMVIYNAIIFAIQLFEIERKK